MKGLVLAVTLTAVAGSGAWAEEKRVKIEVAGMTCPSCPYIAARAIESVKSAKVVEGVFDGVAQIARFVVKFDDAVTTVDAIAGAPKKYGYPGRVMADDGS